MRRLLLVPILLLMMFFAACTPTDESESMSILVRVDGRDQLWSYDQPITIGEFLSEIEVELGELDRVNPPLFTQISDGLRIEIRRVEERTECEEIEKPFQQEYLLDEQVPPGEEILFQPGENGLESICYRIEYVDGVPGERLSAGQPQIIREPINEIIRVGPTETLDDVDIIGTLVYISSGNIWVMTGSNNARRRITDFGDVDPTRPFALGSDGRQLIFTRAPETDDGLFYNELWYVPDVTAAQPQPIQLRPTNILYADWVPNQPNTISYSRAEPRPTLPYWSAYNDLWLMTINPNTGEDVRITPVIEEPNNRGLYAWWGTDFAWSPEGDQLAYVQANGLGLVDLGSGELNQLVDYEVYVSGNDWSWRTTVSWSPDGELIATTTHGAPVADERPDRSPVFNVTFASTANLFQADLVPQAGIWSVPKFSPDLSGGASQFQVSYLAYMLARQPLNSVGNNAEYDLFVADRDGSNARRIFPTENERGLTTRDYVWSPSGRQIALIYPGNTGNIWMVNVETEVSQQLTLDGNVTRLVWSR